MAGGKIASAKGMQRPLARLMVDSLSEARRGRIPWATYGEVSASELVEAADLHKIGPAIYVHLRNADAPAGILSPMHRRYQAQTIRQMQLRADLAALTEILGPVPWAAVKGPVLAERVWSRPDLRQYADLDLVVDRRRFREVLDALLATGATMVDENWALIRDQVRGEVSLTLRRGTALDLHWDVVNDRQLRAYFHFPIDEMLARTRTVTVGSLAVPTFDACDTLLHVAYHTAHSGGHRLLWLKDIERAAADPQIDWGEVSKRAHMYGVEEVLAIVLQRTSDVLGFDVAPPASVLRPARGAWGRLASAAERFFPTPLLPGDRFSGQVVFKSIRPSFRSSLAAAIKTARSRGSGSGDPNENPLHVPAGDAAARESYLAIISGPQRP